MDSPDTTPPTNENEPPAPLPRRSRSTNSLAAPPSNIPSPLSPRRARSASANPNPLPVPPPTITIPPPTSTRPTAAAAEDEPPSTPPLFFPSWTETTSAPALSPSLSSTSFFGDGAVSSFDTQAQTSSALLPGFVAVFSSPRRAGVKRESLVEVVDAQQEEEKEEEEQGHEQKRLRMSVGEE